ncbi:unnamed protein product [Cylicocyclus nassatus]|uniref:Uncharacterized protein n=1 Tax=Cylicocyclus nassatus TaxID=53992 RepID=A0AA36LZ67_CYLNA|nr:unnamed protein product [Cylicocyclus nassatus]
MKVRRSDKRSHHQGGGTHQLHGNNVSGRRSQSSPPQIRRKVQKKDRPQYIPYYRRFDRRLMRSSSTGTSPEASADERELVFLPRQPSRQRIPSRSITYNSDSTESSSGIDIESALSSRAARVSARTSELMYRVPQIWMTSGLFTVTRGKQKISEFVAKYWAVYTSNVKFFVDHVRTLKHPDVTRHTYATTWKTGSTSRVIYFTVDVSTIIPRKPIQVVCSFPNGEKHRPGTSERSFKSFLNGLYWARMQDVND